MTLISPVVPPLGTVAVIWVLELTTKVAATPLIVTEVAPVKLFPVMITEVPMGAFAGVKLVIVGAGVATTVKLVALVVVPAGVLTEIAPEVAPLGTITVIDVLELMTKLGAVVPLNLTALVAAKPLPAILTLLPTEPLVGEKLVIDGTEAMRLL